MPKPLTVYPPNPRYFTDGSGKPVYLTGSHTWNNLQHNEVYPRVDYDEYLDFLRAHNHNFIRLWAWEQAAWDPWTADKVDVYPLAYPRTGPGTALDGKPKFNLNQFNPEYFERLRTRVVSARDYGMYVSIMLFEGWSNRKMDLGGRKKHLPGNPWRGHPFNKENNVNGIDGDADGNGEGEAVHQLRIPAVTRYQEAYVRKVVDTVNELDNVLYEVGNEEHIDTKEWQYHIVNYVKHYEATKPNQHPVGMTSFYAGREDAAEALLESPADWISPSTAGGMYRYDTNPPVGDGRKVIIIDTDHIFGVGGNGVWVWKSFMRGLNPIFMDATDEPTSWKDRIADADLKSARRAMGQTRDYAEKMNLAEMTPQNELSSTQYCLASLGKEYLIYQPEQGAFSTNIKGDEGTTFSVEWFQPETGKVTFGTPITVGMPITFTPPFDDPAVLYLSMLASPT